MFPCLAKFRDASILNSVQSTLQRTFFNVLNTFGRNFRKCYFVGNITVSMSLNTLYMS